MAAAHVSGIAALVYDHLGAARTPTNADKVLDAIVSAAKDLGQPGTKSEQAVIGNGQTYYGKEKDSVSVIMPLRDRNGDPIAAVRVVMKPFPGQTEQNVIVRAVPVVKQMQAHVQSMQDLVE